MVKGVTMSPHTNIEDVKPKKGLPIAEGLMDQRVLNTEEGKGAISGSERLSILVQTYEPGGCHNPHEHESTEQAFLVLSGEGKMIVGDEEIPIKKGSVVYAPPKVRHSTENTGDENLRMMLIGVTLD